MTTIQINAVQCAGMLCEIEPPVSLDVPDDSNIIGLLDDGLFNYNFDEPNKVRDVLRLSESQAVYSRVRDLVDGYNLETGGPLDFDVMALPEEILCKLREMEMIVLLLESPHKNEYDEDFLPRTPAAGKTGERLEAYYSECSVSEPFSQHPVILCNPVQWQTSLHYFHGLPLKYEAAVLRNAVWNAFWENAVVRECFWTRLTNYAPRLLVNCCTEVKKRGALIQPYRMPKMAVNEFLDSNNLPNEFRCSIGHPSSWVSRRRRDLYRQRVSESWQASEILASQAFWNGFYSDSDFGD